MNAAGDGEVSGNLLSQGWIATGIGIADRRHHRLPHFTRQNARPQLEREAILSRHAHLKWKRLGPEVIMKEFCKRRRLRRRGGASRLGGALGDMSTCCA